MVLQSPIVVFINDDDRLFFSTSENQRDESNISFDDDFVDLKIIKPHRKSWVLNQFACIEIPNPDEKFQR
jgi:hypothetical protein